MFTWPLFDARDGSKRGLTARFWPVQCSTDEFHSELEATDLFLFLVSPDFIASDYCVEQEMRRALERHDAGDARVVPIIVEPCNWTSMNALRRLKAVPIDGKPVSE